MTFPWGEWATSGNRLLTEKATPLLWCGVVAGPLFTGLTLLQTMLRDDHDLREDPVSLLSLGEFGWVQIANFVVTGLLAVAFAVGLRRLGQSGWWIPALIAVLGVGLVATGLFVTDAPSTPTTWHGAAHDVASAVAINAGLLATVVFAFRVFGAGRRGWASYSVGTALAVIAMGWARDTGTIGLRHTAVAVLLTLWVTAVAAHPYSRPQSAPRSDHPYH